jgi:hypothetical protein
MISVRKKYAAVETLQNELFGFMAVTAPKAEDTTAKD